MLLKSSISLLFPFLLTLCIIGSWMFKSNYYHWIVYFSTQFCQVLLHCTLGLFLGKYIYWLINVKYVITVVWMCIFLITVRLRIFSYVYWPFGFILLIIGCSFLINILLHVWKTSEQVLKRKASYIKMDIVRHICMCVPTYGQYTYIYVKCILEKIWNDKVGRIILKSYSELWSKMTTFIIIRQMNF